MIHPVKHFITITKHRHVVIKHCRKAGILWQGLRHDLSKYSPSEFIPGAKYFQGDRSPNEEERRLYGYSKAWMHHKGRNRHHFEYWTDYDPKTKLMEPVKMPPRYVAEMFCDRVAACRIYQGEKYTDAQKNASIKYLKEKTDSIQIRTPKGTKDKWRAAATQNGKSLNQFIVDAVEGEIEKAGE